MKDSHKEFSQNGIECNAITDIGSLPIEKKSYYSHLFPMSPKNIFLQTEVV